MLPISTADGRGAPLVDALFTSTSAVCVTGLVVHDTATYWSPFGQVVLLGLIQLGGMGVVTVVVGLWRARRRMSLRQRAAVQESLAAPAAANLMPLVGFIVRTALMIELVGALLLATVSAPVWRSGPVVAGCSTGCLRFATRGSTLWASRPPMRR